MKRLFKIFAGMLVVLIAVNSKAQLSQPIDFPLPINLAAADVSAVEYYFDNDPGFGNGINISIAPGSNVSVNNFTVSIDTLSTGVHRLYVRAKNTNGAWSLNNVATFFIIPQSALFPSNANAANVSAAEYYFDNDPGLGNGANISIASGNDITANNVAVNIDTLSTGVHRLYVRAKNTNGAWSITNTASFYIVQGSSYFPANENAANVSAAECFLDADPGLGMGTNIPIASGGDVSVSNFAVNIGALATGVHRIYVRTQNINGVWSITNVATFYIVPVSFSLPPNTPGGNITALEYFFDSDPGFGNGTMISITPSADLSDYQITADISGLQQDTIHTLYIRALDGWSQTTSTTFALGAIITPIKWISFSGKLQDDNSILLQWATTSEENNNYFEIERSNDGTIFKSIGKINADSIQRAEHDYQFVDKQPESGNNFYRIKQTDKDGNYLYSSVLSIETNNRSAFGFYIINNPARSILRVHTGVHESNAQLQIFDIKGKRLTQISVNTNDIQQIDISQLPKGVYIIRCASSNEIVSKKFIKE